MKKILICDDDEGILEVIKIMLEGAGFNVNSLSNGKAIIKKVTQYKPNLILLDVGMPGIDGKEVTKILKKNDLTKNIPVIIVSAYNDTEKIAKNCGADGFLSKPFEMNNLLDTAKRYTS